MSFIFSLTWREIRASWPRLLFFFVCIGVGTGSIIALRSTIQNLNRAVAAEARYILTADIEINSTAPFTEAELAAINRVAEQNRLRLEARNEIIQTNTMSRPSDDAKPGVQMLELKGVEPGFPLVGEFRLENGALFDYQMLENNGAVVAPLLLEKLNLKINDSIRIGTEDFQIRGTFTEEPGGTAGFRLGPRVFIERSAFDTAGLTSFGSRNRRKILFRIAENNPDNLATEFRTALKNVGSIATVRSYKESQENLAESFDRAENYLSLTGLVILVLGGIGVWNVTRVFVEQKKSSIAILKCVGASGTSVITVYLLQILTLGFLGGAFGTLLAQIALVLIKTNFAKSLPPAMNYNLQPNAVLQGFLLGIFVSALFAALPLLQIRQIKPRLLLRDSTQEALKKFDLLNFLIAGAVLAGLLLLAVWQAGSWRIGLYFLLGLSITAAVLYLLAFVLTALLRKFSLVSTFAVRQSIKSLARPGNQTRVILLAIGLGVFVVLSVQLLQNNLLSEFDLARNGTLPSLFLIDVQRNQTQPVQDLIKQEIGETIEYIPAVRGRLVAVNNQSFDFAQPATRQQQGQLGREYVMTYRPRLVGSEQIVAGKFWDETPSSEPEVSLGEDMRGLQGLDLGGTVTFDVQGQKVTARVTSFRRFDVRNPRSTFIVVFRPGTLETAPQTLLAPVFSSLEPNRRLRLQRALVTQFPNISAIDTADAVSAVKRILDNITLAVSFVGAFVFLTGVLILIGSIALTKFQRIYENAILKTLGARRRTLLAILLIEYGLLGFLAAATGIAAANALSYAVANYVFKINWNFNPELTLLSALLTIALVVMVAAASSFDVLLRKPLATLRSQ